MKIAVLGGGNGGHVMSADLSMAGHEVRFYELPGFENNIKGALKKGGIELISRNILGEEITASAGGETGFTEISKITTNIKEAIEGVELIMVVVPAFAQKVFAEKMAPYLEDGQIIVFHPDNFGTLECVKVFREMGMKKDVTMAGTECLIYSCRMVGSGKVWLMMTKNKVTFSAFPATKTKETLQLVNKVYPQLIPANNVLETSIHNVNIICHPTSMILNVVKIEKMGPYEYSAYDITPSMARVMEALDREKIAVAKAVGLKGIPYKDVLSRYYDAKGGNIYETLRNSKCYKLHMSPNSMKFRYVTEDIPYGHVPIACLGKLTKVPTPIFTAMISLASVINQTDYCQTGRTLDKMGLEGLNARQVIEFVTYGTY